MEKPDLSEWEERRSLLIKFQKNLMQQFQKEDYNVFVFGSFIRSDFVAGESDIDMIVYCEDKRRQESIADFCRDFFDQTGIKSDILEYFYSESAYIFANGILNAFPMTEYYPDSLKGELYLIVRNYRRHLGEKKRREKYYHWAYICRNAGNGD